MTKDGTMLFVFLQNCVCSILFASTAFIKLIKYKLKKKNYQYKLLITGSYNKILTSCGDH